MCLQWCQRDEAQQRSILLTVFFGVLTEHERCSRLLSNLTPLRGILALVTDIVDYPAKEVVALLRHVQAPLIVEDFSISALLFQVKAIYR